MNHQDKFWQAFREKVEDHTPSEYSAAEWSAMEQLLDAGGTAAPDSAIATQATKPWWAFWQVWLVALICTGLAFWALATTDLNLTADASTATTEQAPPLSSTVSMPVVEGSLTTPSDLATDELRAEEMAAVTATPNLSTKAPLRVATRSAGEGRSTDSQAAETLAAEASTSSSERLAGRTAGTPTTAPPPVNLPPQGTELPLAATPLENELISSGIGESSTADPESTETTTTLTREERTVAGTALAAAATSNTVPARNNTVVSPLAGSALQPLATDAPADDLELDYITAPTHYTSRWSPALIFGGSVLLHSTGGEQPAFGPVVGLSLQRRLSRKWSLELELLTRLIYDYNLKLTASDTFVNLNGNVLFHNESETVQSYFALDIPLVLRYHANSRWILAGGLRYSHITPTGTAGSTSWNGGPIREVAARFKQSQMWLHNYGVLLGVDYRLAPKWSLRLRYTQGLRDLSPNNLYESTDIHQDSDFQITARKTF